LAICLRSLCVGGSTWTLKIRGIAGDEPFAWRLSRAPNGGIYLVVARRSGDGTIGDAGDGGSTSQATLPSGGRVCLCQKASMGRNGLGVDPGNPQRLLLAAWRRRVRGSEGGGGIYLSSDGGANWKHVLQSDQHIYDVSLDTHDSRTWYACGFESSAWRSTDGGETWQRIRGYNFKWGHRVIPDPSNASLIYVTTFGGSVWHGPPPAILKQSRIFSALELKLLGYPNRTKRFQPDFLACTPNNFRKGSASSAVSGCTPRMA
jgi:hypothetical protein